MIELRKGKRLSGGLVNTLKNSWLSESKTLFFLVTFKKFKPVKKKKSMIKSGKTKKKFFSHFGTGKFQKF